MQGQGEIDINQSVSNNATDVQRYIDVDVSSKEEVYHEEEVLCVHSLLCYLWGWNLTVLKKRGEFTMLMHSKWVLVFGLHHQGTVLLQGAY